jgi:hypothetical protein
MADLVTPMAVRIAATLRIADHIVAGVRTAEGLAEAAGADTGALDRLLRHLVTVAVLTRDDEGRYALTARGEALRDDHPSRVRSMLATDSAIGRGDLAFAHLLHSVMTGEAAFDVAFGRPFWDDLAADPARTASYDEQMGVDVAAWAPPVIAAYDWGALGHVVDVGGGNGTLLAALLEAFPNLRGTVLDQPATAAAARTHLAAAGVSDRGDAVAGSFFDPLPAGAGGYVLCAVLHDWDDRAAAAILRRCRDAAGTAGRVLVIEKTGVGGESPRTAMDLRVLVYFGGRERGVHDLVALAADAGLRHVATHDAGDLAVVELASRTSEKTS